MINRSLVIIKPRQPFYDWSNNLTPDFKIEMAEVDDHNAYLLEDELFLNDLKKELAPYWESIFEQELYGHWTDESKWPELTWERFLEWFEVVKSSIVIDLVDGPVRKQ